MCELRKEIMLCWCGLALARWEASGKVGTLSVPMYLGVQAAGVWPLLAGNASGKVGTPSVLLNLGVQADGRITDGRSSSGHQKRRWKHSSTFIQTSRFQDATSVSKYMWSRGTAFSWWGRV